MTGPSVSSELARIDALVRIFGKGGVRVGIGDDAAVIAAPGTDLVWTVDTAVEGVHFERAWLSFEELGARSFMAAASDLAAMGAEPLAALSALALPNDLPDDAVLAIARGQRAAAGEVGAPVVGGNLSRAGEISITTTILGTAARPVLRSGARPGDRVWIQGSPGLASLGLLALRRGAAPPRGSGLARALEAFRAPLARLDGGRAAREVATAMIDLSDGLARDLAHLCRASGVGARLVANHVLTPEVREAAAALGRAPLDHALLGGEDYALIATSPAEIAGFRAIGVILSEPGMWLETEDGELAPIPEGGHDHFRDQNP